MYGSTRGSGPWDYFGYTLIRISYPAPLLSIYMYSTRFSRIHIIQVHVQYTVDQPPFKLSQLVSPLRVDPKFMMGQIGRSLGFVTEPWDRLRKKKLCRSDAKAASVSEIVLMINLSVLRLTSVAVPHTASSLPLVRHIL